MNDFGLDVCFFFNSLRVAMFWKKSGFFPGQGYLREFWFVLEKAIFNIFYEIVMCLYTEIFFVDENSCNKG